MTTQHNYSSDISEKIPVLKKEISKALDDILNWWSSNMVDEQTGGFYGRIDSMGQLHSSSPKGVILNSRILWTFSAAARKSGKLEHKNMADYAFQYFIDHFIDEEEGGVYWMLDHNGIPLDGKKQIYAQSFAIYAFAEYYLLTKNQLALGFAVELFWLIEKYSRDQEQGGYFEAFDQSWKKMEDLRLSEKDQNEAKTMNTHLHILEAYTNLYRIDPNQALKSALEHLISLFLEKFIRTNTGQLNLFFDEHWKLKSKAISYGHDIECSWLLLEAAEVLGDASLINKVQKISIKMVNATLKEGMDQDGGIWNEDNGNGHIDREKHWWPQAEAMVGFVNAWQISGKEIYLKSALRNWIFIQNQILDKTHGEWHWGILPDGKIMHHEDKAGPWKAPYHNARACLELLSRLP